MQSGGRSGRHTEHLGFILTELQFLQRTYPGQRSGDHGADHNGREGDVRSNALGKLRASVVDPEIPVLSIADLGVLRDMQIVNGTAEVTITPTYSGCPAMNLIALNVELALEEVGFVMPRIKTVLSPAWTTDWMTEKGKATLRKYGIAPPAGKASRRALVRRGRGRLSALRFDQHSAHL